MACQDWANTKAAYRFLSNERVREDSILAGHFQSTRELFATTEEWPWCCTTRRNFPTIARTVVRFAC
jgi:hypothetical protein